MKRFAGVVVLLAVLAVAPLASGQESESKFVAPEVMYASDIAYPQNSTAAGLVSLCVSLDNSAHIQSVSVMRDVTSLTSAAILAVNGWTFTPASLNGKPRASVTTVNVLFNPPDFYPGALQITPVQTGCQPQENAGFVPPEIQTAAYAPYPVNSVAAGALVLSVTVSATGRVRRISVVRPVPALIKPALAAVKKWTFKPGTVDGVPVTSNTIVAIAFRWITINSGTNRLNSAAGH